MKISEYLKENNQDVVMRVTLRILARLTYTAPDGQEVPILNKVNLKCVEELLHSDVADLDGANK